MKIKRWKCHFCNKDMDYDLKVNMLNDPQWVEHQCCYECKNKKERAIRSVTITG